MQRRKAGRITLGVVALLFAIAGIDGAIDSDCNICSEDSERDLRALSILLGVLAVVAFYGTVRDSLRLAGAFVAAAFLTFVAIIFEGLSNLQ